MEIKREPAPGEQALAQIRAIYTTSFPPSEREAWADIRAGIVAGTALLYTAQEADIIVAFALVNPLSGTRVFLLGYIAVAPECRSRGYGSLLLRYLATDLRVAYNADGLLLEVEPPDQGPQAERLIRQRRLGFYQQHGARVIHVAYRMPNLAGEGSFPMLLLWLPLSQQDPPAGAQLVDCIMRIYTDSYGRSSDDPLLASILRSL